MKKQTPLAALVSLASLMSVAVSATAFADSTPPPPTAKDALVLISQMLPLTAHHSTAYADGWDIHQGGDLSNHRGSCWLNVEAGPNNYAAVIYSIDSMDDPVRFNIDLSNPNENTIKSMTSIPQKQLVINQVYNGIPYDGSAMMTGGTLKEAQTISVSVVTGANGIPVRTITLTERSGLFGLHVKTLKECVIAY